MGKVKRLNICHINVRSILAATRLMDLEILCANHDIDILCVTETWLSASSTPLGSNLINLAGFQPPFRRDRSGRRGGGVAMYFRKGLTATMIPFPNSIESTCIKIILSKRKHIYVTTIYRPPGSTSVDVITDLQAGIDKILATTLSASWVTSMPGIQLGGMVKQLMRLEELCWTLRVPTV